MSIVEKARQKSWFTLTREKIMGRVYDAGFSFALNRFEQLTENIEVIYSDSFTQKLKEDLTRGHLVLVVANHQSHADAFPMAKVIQQITNTINGFLPEDQNLHGFRIPIAQTLENAGQSPYLTSAYNKFKPFVERFKLFPLLYSRKNDGNAFSLNTLKQVLGARESGYGVAILPEGTVKSGRTTNGVINGIQPCGEENLSILINAVDNPGKGRKVLIIPVSINGTYNIYSPDKKHPSLGELIRIMKPKTMARKITVAVHEPITSESLYRFAEDLGITENEYSKWASTYIFQQIESVLPPEAKDRRFLLLA